MIDLHRDAPLGYALVRVAKTHRRWVSAELMDMGLHIGQELLLAQLCREEGIRQTALAEALDIELPTVHRALARLEAAGFVRLRRDPHDARASLAYLSPRGRATCARIREIWQAADQRLHEALTEEEAARLEGLLAQMADHIKHA